MTMNGFIKNIGVLVLLIGAVILAVPFFTGGMSNTVLLAGVSTMIIGYFCHIIINRKTE